MSAKKPKPASERMIRREIRRLVDARAGMKTNHGQACAFNAECALAWVLNPRDAANPTGLAEVADAGAITAKKHGWR